jgi:hypothetical protein
MAGGRIKHITRGGKKEKERKIKKEGKELTASKRQI